MYRALRLDDFTDPKGCFRLDLFQTSKFPIISTTTQATAPAASKNSNLDNAVMDKEL